MFIEKPLYLVLKSGKYEIRSKSLLEARSQRQRFNESLFVIVVPTAREAYYNSNIIIVFITMTSIDSSNPTVFIFGVLIKLHL